MAWYYGATSRETLLCTLWSLRSGMRRILVWSSHRRVGCWKNALRHLNHSKLIKTNLIQKRRSSHTSCILSKLLQRRVLWNISAKESRFLLSGFTRNWYKSESIIDKRSCATALPYPWYPCISIFQHGTTTGTNLLLCIWEAIALIALSRTH